MTSTTKPQSGARPFTVSEEKKEHIFNTALHLFDQYGFQHISVNRIYSEAKIAKQTFYTAFPSKDIFVFHCLDLEISKLKASLSALVSQYEISASIPMLKAIYQWHVDLAQKDGFNGTLLTKAVVEYWNLEQVQKLVKDFNNWKYEFILECLSEAAINDSIIRVIVNALNGILLPDATLFLSWEDIETLVK
jgi:Transcriptional regulator